MKHLVKLSLRTHGIAYRGGNRAFTTTFSSDASSLQLNRKPLEQPHVHEVSWKPYQAFTAEDDPDRTKVHWKPPHFFESVDPVVRSLSTTVEQLDVSQVIGYRDGFSFASYVRGVMTESECADLLQHVNMKGFTPALVNIGDGRQKLLPRVRHGLRMIHDSTAISSWLLEVLRPHLPHTLNAGASPFGQLFSGNVELSRINERCRFLCYIPGQQFKRHSDGGEVWPREARTGKVKLEALTLVTLQLYLHDVPKDYGGATSFIIRGQHGEEKLECQPCIGSVLLFTQDLSHEGSHLERGFKYTMRSDAFYTIPHA